MNPYYSNNPKTCSNLYVSSVLIAAAAVLLSCCPRAYVVKEPLFSPYSDDCSAGYYDAEGAATSCIPESWIEYRISADSLNRSILDNKFKEKCSRRPSYKECRFWLAVDSLVGSDGYLCYFNSPQEYWESSSGRAGWAIEIGGRIRFVFVEEAN